MKSQIQEFIFYLAVAAGSITSAQPKLSVDLGLGFYQPTLTGFDENESVPFPAAGILNRNLLLNWGVYYEFFSNARVGYNSFTSLELGKLGLINSAESIFRRTLRYRMFPIETFFRWRPKIELNFTLAPIWGRGRITVDTSPGDKADDWNYLLNSFGDDSPISEMGTTDAMLVDWIGYSGMIGMRYYLSSRLGLDVKMGFMNNYYNNENWRVQTEKVIGPKMTITKLPIFSIKIIYGFK